MEDTEDDPLLQDEEEQDTMSAGEPHAGAPPFHNHINTSVLNQLKQRFEEVPESIVIKVLKEVCMIFTQSTQMRLLYFIDLSNWA